MVAFTGAGIDSPSAAEADRMSLPWIDVQ